MILFTKQNHKKSELRKIIMIIFLVCTQIYNMKITNNTKLITINNRFYAYVYVDAALTLY